MEEWRLYIYYAHVLVVTINKPLADLFIHQIFFRQMLDKSKFAKHSPCQAFPLYGTPCSRDTTKCIPVYIQMYQRKVAYIK